MIRPITIATIEQVPTDDMPLRNDVFDVYFLSSSNGFDSVDNFTFNFELVFPKNIYVYKGNERVNWTNKNVTEGDNPLIIRGDKITVKWRTYYYQYKDVNDTKKEKMVENTIFEGYVSSIDNSTPITIYCENEMYILKQTEVANKVWQGSKYSLESMLEEMLKGTGISIKTDGVASTIGEVTTINATIAEVLDQLSSDYKYTFYFVGKELKAGIFRYYPNDRQFHKFSFQKNIIESQLEYKRFDDVKVKLVAYSIDKFETTTASGKKSRKKKRLQVDVGDSFGDRRTAYFPDVKTEKELREKAEAFYTQIKYDGFQGSFTTFSIPKVSKGDVVELQDNYLPERNGSYLVKAVEYSGGVDGYRQKIDIDYKVSSNYSELI